MDDQSKNLILATALSFLVILAWFFFFPPEQAQTPPATQTTQQDGTATAPATAITPIEAGVSGVRKTLVSDTQKTPAFGLSSISPKPRITLPLVEAAVAASFSGAGRASASSPFLHAARIELEARDPDGLFRRYGPRPAEHGLHPFDDLGRVEGFGHVVVRPHPQPDEPVDLVDPGRDHDDRRVARPPHLPQHLEAVDPGQRHVEQDEVGFGLTKQAQGVFAVGGAFGAEAVPAQVGLQHLAQVRFVFGDEDERRRVHAPSVVNKGCNQ